MNNFENNDRINGTEGEPISVQPEAPVQSEVAVQPAAPEVPTATQTPLQAETPAATEAPQAQDNPAPVSSAPQYTAPPAYTAGPHVRPPYTAPSQYIPPAQYTVPQYTIPPVQPQPPAVQPQVQNSTPAQEEKTVFEPRTDEIVPPDRTKGSKRGFAFFMGFIAVVIALSIGITAGYYMGGDYNPDSVPQGGVSADKDENEENTFSGSVDVNIQHRSDPTGESLTLSQVAEKVKPSIVVICVYSTANDSSSYSSGVIMSKDGYIVTNDHIFTDISKPVIYVTTYDGKTHKAKFVAGDSRGDIAVIKIDAEGLTPATFGYSSELVVGEQVAAIGNAAGLDFSVTDGIVSALERRLADSQGYSARYVQTSAPISPGSSGGALVNMDGQVIGITTSKIADSVSEGLSFAIPSDRAVSIVTELLKNGYISRAKLGISYNEINVAAAELNDLPVGLRIVSVNSDSNLSGKVSSGDVIVGAGEIKSNITSSNVLDMLETMKPGDELSLYIKTSSGESKTLKAKLIQDKGSSNYSTSSDEDLEPLY